MYALVKNLHMAFAALTFAGFLLRGFWMATGSGLLQTKPARVLPHVIDTLFLLTGIWLVVLLRLPVSQSPWLIAKLVALVAYIVLGTIALKRGRTMRGRAIAFVLAVTTFAYIIGVAIGKSPYSWLALA